MESQPVQSTVLPQLPSLSLSLLAAFAMVWLIE